MAPLFLQKYLPPYNLSRLDLHSSFVRGEIITKILNLGDEKAVLWLFDTYTLEEIRNVVKKPKKGAWNSESLNYWKEILKINHIEEPEKAILNINPV